MWNVLFCYSRVTKSKPKHRNTRNYFQAVYFATVNLSTLMILWQFCSVCLYIILNVYFFGGRLTFLFSHYFEKVQFRAQKLSVITNSTKIAKNGKIASDD